MVPIFLPSTPAASFKRLRTGALRRPRSATATKETRANDPPWSDRGLGTFCDDLPGARPLPDVEERRQRRALASPRGFSLAAANNANFFAYFDQDYAGIGLVLPYLASCGFRGRPIFGAILRKNPVAAARQSGIFVHDVPPPLREVMSQADVILHHGGVNTAETPSPWVGHRSSSLRIWRGDDGKSDREPWRWPVHSAALPGSGGARDASRALDERVLRGGRPRSRARSSLETIAARFPGSSSIAWNGSAEIDGSASEHR